MIKFELLLYDLDGTLIDSKDDIADAVNMTMAELNLPQLPPTTIYSYVGSGVRELLKNSLQNHNCQEYQKSLKIFREKYLSNLLNKTRLFDGAFDVLTAIHKTKATKQAIVTNKPAEYTDKIVTGLHLTEVCSLTIGSKENWLLKPDPFMLHLAINSMKVDPAKVLMIGDGVNDILAARAAGVQVCAVGYGFGEKQELLEHSPDFFIPSIRNLPEIINL